MVAITEIEKSRSGFNTVDEDHPEDIVQSGTIKTTNEDVDIKTLRKAIPAYCFQPSLFWSFFYLARDLFYSAILMFANRYAVATLSSGPYQVLYYPAMMLYGICQGIVWTGIWVVAHECGHSAFSKIPAINDLVGFVCHSALLTPYFSWKSTHRRHHIHAGHMDKDLHYVPLLKDGYAASIGAKLDQIEELGQDAPLYLTIRIAIQQLVGFSSYITLNITCPPTAVLKQDLPSWRYSHFDPWSGMFRSSEWLAVVLSDIGCLLAIGALYQLKLHFGSFEQLFWFYVVPWMWVNHWIVMITYLHHTHKDIPKYDAASWTFIRGATATIDRDFGIIGTHFFHNIACDHVTHHLFSKIPHYYAPVATKAIAPLLGNQYRGHGDFTYDALKDAFVECQWVEKDADKDKKFGLDGSKEGHMGLWYKGGKMPPLETKMRR